MSSEMVLVTGGSGFIGCHLVYKLMMKGYLVRVIDDFSSGRRENLKEWLQNERLDLIRGDLKTPSIANRAVEGCSLIFHLAANPDVRAGGIDPSVHFKENLIVTFNLLEAMRKTNSSKQMIFASSSTVYGEADKFPTPENYGPLLPISIYGASKLGCESLISSFCYTFGLQSIMLRFANIVGSRSNHGVVLDFIRKLRQDPSTLEILGDGTQKKSYLHVSDLVDVFFLMLARPKRPKPAEVYNVGSTDQVSVIRIAEIVCEEMGIAKPTFRFKQITPDGRGWKGDVKNMFLDTDKLGQLGWRETMNSEAAIRRSCSELLSEIQN